LANLSVPVRILIEAGRLGRDIREEARCRAVAEERQANKTPDSYTEEKRLQTARHVKEGGKTRRPASELEKYGNEGGIKKGEQTSSKGGKGAASVPEEDCLTTGDRPLAFSQTKEGIPRVTHKGEKDEACGSRKASLRGCVRKRANC